MELVETAFKWLLDHVIGAIVIAGSVFVFKWANDFYRKKRLFQAMEEAYTKLRWACQPETLHPDYPGNPAHIKAEARDAANLLTGRLKKAGFFPPPRCTDDEQSLQMWYAFLEHVRIEIG